MISPPFSPLRAFLLAGYLFFFKILRRDLFTLLLVFLDRTFWTPRLPEPRNPPSPFLPMLIAYCHPPRDSPAQRPFPLDQDLFRSWIYSYLASLLPSFLLSFPSSAPHSVYFGTRQIFCRLGDQECSFAGLVPHGPEFSFPFFSQLLVVPSFSFFPVGPLSSPRGTFSCGTFSWLVRRSCRGCFIFLPTLGPILIWSRRSQWLYFSNWAPMQLVFLLGDNFFLFFVFFRLWMMAPPREMSRY